MFAIRKKIHKTTHHVISCTLYLKRISDRDQVVTVSPWRRRSRSSPRRPRRRRAASRRATRARPAPRSAARRTASRTPAPAPAPPPSARRRPPAGRTPGCRAGASWDADAKVAKVSHLVPGALSEERRVVALLAPGDLHGGLKLVDEGPVADLGSGTRKREAQIKLPKLVRALGPRAPRLPS